MGRGQEARRWRCRAVPVRRHPFESAGFRVGSRSGEVLHDSFGRPISLDPPELAAITCVRAMGDRSKLSRGTISFALESLMEKKVMADKWFFDDGILRLETRALG